MNIQEATPIELTEQERSALETMIRSPKTEHGIVERARIVVLAAEGRSTRSIADERGTWPGRVSRWRTHFARQRLEGLHDLPRPGSTPRYGVDTGKRILALLDQPAPASYGRWTALLLSRELIDVSDQSIWRFLREQKIDLAARKSWCQTDDPDFVAKAAEIVGLYLDPPDDAIVLAVDEKPHIQALERAQGYLKLPNGRALSGRSHDYKRHGTSTLFAALDVLSGQVTASHYKRRRRIEFLDFMNRIVAAYPGKDIHAILDNLSIHKPKRERWLARHRNVRFHFTPTYSSWLNQIEIWFSILPRRRQLHRHRPTQGPHQRLRRQLQHTCRALRLDKARRPSKTSQATFLRLMIPGTSSVHGRWPGQPPSPSKSIPLLACYHLLTIDELSRPISCQQFPTCHLGHRSAARPAATSGISRPISL